MRKTEAHAAAKSPLHLVRDGAGGCRATGATVASGAVAGARDLTKPSFAAF
jgi:hypothetical protein